MKLSDEEYLETLYAQKEKDLTLIAKWDECIYARQVAVAFLPIYERAIKKYENLIAFKRIIKNQLLIPALREFNEPNNADGFVYGFDLEETERIFSKLMGELVRTFSITEGLCLCRNS